MRLAEHGFRKTSNFHVDKKEATARGAALLKDE